MTGGGVISMKDSRMGCGKRVQQIVVVVILFLMNLLLTGWGALSRQGPIGDEFMYLDVAGNVYEGEGFVGDAKSNVNNPQNSSPYPIGFRFLYPYLCSLAFRLAGGVSLGVCCLVSAIFKSLLVVVIFYLGHQLYDYRTGLLAAVLYSLHPLHNWLGLIAYTDITAVFFFYVCLLLFLRYSVGKQRFYVALSGGFLALAFLTREQAMVLAPFIVLLLIFTRSAKIDILLFLSSFLIAFLMRSWYLDRTFGHLHLNAQPLWLLPNWEFFYSFEPMSWSWYLDHVGGLGKAIEIRMLNCVAFAENFLSDGIILDSDAYTGGLPVLSLPVLLFAYMSKAEPKKRRSILVISLLIVLQIAANVSYPGYPLYGADSRMGRMAVPFLMLMTSVGLIALWRGEVSILRKNGQWLRAYLPRTIVTIFLLYYILFSSIYLTRWVDGLVLSPPHLRGLQKLAKWCRDNIPSSSMIMTRKSNWVHYYSERTTVVAPLADFRAMMEYARRNGVTHVTVASQERGYRPNLLPGILAQPHSFKLIHQRGEDQVYEVLNYDFLEGGLDLDAGGDYLPKWMRRQMFLSLPWDEVWKPKRRQNLARSLETWTSWATGGMEASQRWATRLKYGQLNWLHKAISSPHHRLDISVEGKLKLLGYDLDTSLLKEQGKLRLDLCWESLQTTAKDYTVYVKLINGAYHVWGESEGALWRDELESDRWEKGIVLKDRHEIDVLPGTSPGPYQVEIHLYDPQHAHWLKPAREIVSEPIELPRCVPPIELLLITYPVNVDLGGKVRLLGYNIESGFRPGDGIHLTLFWQVLQKMDRDYTVFTHLLDGEGKIQGQKDNEPSDGFYPTTKWEVGDIVRDQYDLVISPDAPLGQYQLEIGMYLAETGERLKVNGSFEADRVLLNEVEIRP